MIQRPNARSPLIEYPETDGQPMTESDATRNYILGRIAAYAELERSRVQAEQEAGEAQHQAEQERQRAEQAEARLAALEEQLRQQGIDPGELG